MTNVRFKNSYNRPATCSEQKSTPYVSGAVISTNRPKLTDLDIKIINATNSKSTFSFFNKPSTAILSHYLLPFLNLEKDAQTITNLIHVSKKGNLFQMHQRESCLKKLLEAICLHRNKKKVENMLTTCSPSLLPYLLLTPLEVKDYLGRRFFGTALRLALYMGDVQHRYNEGIAELIIGFLRKLPNGHILIKKQILEQFQEDQTAQNTLQIVALQNVVHAIKASTEGNCKAEVNAFKTSFKLKFRDVIRSGKDTTPEIFALAYKWSSDLNSRQKEIFYEIRLFLESYLPSHYSQYLNSVYNQARISDNETEGPCDLGDASWDRISASMFITYAEEIHSNLKNLCHCMINLDSSYDSFSKPEVRK